MSKKSDASTGAIALKAMNDDPEIVQLLVRVGRKYELEKAFGLVQKVIERSLSTSALSAEYHDPRPSGLEFFKFELHRLVDDD
jgi:hypothetical protein